MRFYEKLLPLAKDLRARCHTVEMPEKTAEKLNRSKLISRHLAKLRTADALLIANFDGYIGASAFFEAGWAFALAKPIFCLEKLDETSAFTEDLRAIGAVELDNDFNKLKGTNPVIPTNA